MRTKDYFRFLFVTLCICFCVVFFQNKSYAATFTEGYLTYIENEDGTLTVTGYDPAQYANFAPLEIKNTVNGKTVTNIAERAFQDKWFEYVSIDSNIDIGAFAFKNVYIEGKLPEQFATVIPEQYEYNLYIGNDSSGNNKIGAYAFASARIERNIVLNSNISIDDYAFKDASFWGIYQPDSFVTHIGKNAFDGSGYTSGLNYSGLISVKSDAFKNCKLTDFTIPSTLETFDTTLSGGMVSDYFEVYIADGVKDISCFHLENIAYTLFHISASSPLSTYLSANNMTYTVTESEDPDYTYSKPGIGQLISNGIFTVKVTGDSTATLFQYNQPSDSTCIDFDEATVVDYHGYRYTITSISPYAIRPENCTYLDTITFGHTITKVEAYAITIENYNLSKIVLSNPSMKIEQLAFPNTEYLTIELLPSVTTLDNYNLTYLTNVVFLVPENSPLIQMLVNRNLTFQTPGSDPIKPGSPDYPEKSKTEQNQNAATEHITTEDKSTSSSETSTEVITTETSTMEIPTPAVPTTETPTTEVPSSANNTPSPTKTRPAKGTILTYKKIQYKVTGKNTVTFLKPSNIKITKLTVPSSITYNSYKFKVTKINKKACYQCKKLKIVTIGNNVTHIGDNAFAKCSSLRTILFGKNVKELGKRVLYYDKKLSRITFKGSKLHSIGKETFRKVPKTVDIIVPSSKVRKYSQLINNAK